MPTATPTYTHTSTPLTNITSTATPCVINFIDVHQSDYFYQDVQCVYCMGAGSGYADGTFKPFNNTTRGQTVKIIVLALRIPIATPGGTPTFSDVPLGSPFYAYVETAAAANIVGGYADGTFRPNNNVTRGQISKMVSAGARQVFGWAVENPGTPTFSDVPPGAPFYEDIETAVCHGLISGYADGTFKPGLYALRAQIAKIVCRASQNPRDTCSTTPTPTPMPTHTPGSMCSGIPPSPNVRITPSNCEPVGTSFTFTASGFQPGEMVSIWATDPDGNVFGAPFQLQAGQTGSTPPTNFGTTTGFPTGLWRLTFSGDTSQFRAVGNFMLTP